MKKVLIAVAALAISSVAVATEDSIVVSYVDAQTTGLDATGFGVTATLSDFVLSVDIAEDAGDKAAYGTSMDYEVRNFSVGYQFHPTENIGVYPLVGMTEVTYDLEIEKAFCNHYYSNGTCKVWESATNEGGGTEVLVGLGIHYSLLGKFPIDLQIKQTLGDAEVMTASAGIGYNF